MSRDMRDWIELLRAHEEVIKIKKEVDVSDGMGALIPQSREKALLFENLKGHPSWRVLAQAPANMRQCGLAFGVPAQDGVAMDGLQGGHRCHQAFPGGVRKKRTVQAIDAQGVSKV